MKHYEKGERVWVEMGSKKMAAGYVQKQKIAGIVLATAFSAEGNYDQCKVELLVVNTLAPAQLLRQVYPHPIQSYKLTKRYETLPGEEVQRESTI